MPWELQATAALGAASEELFPVDVSDFLDLCPVVGASLFCTMAVAVLQEPTSTRIFVDNVKDKSDAWNVREALIKVAREHAAAPRYRKESEQMTKKAKT